jgi:hypothetical protein
MFRLHREDIRRVVWRQLGPRAQPEDVDDGVSYIVDRLVARDILALYQPDYVSDYNHQSVTFKAFLMGNVAIYCRGLRETLAKRREREAVSVDEPGWIDSGDADEYPSLASGLEMELLRTALAARAPAPGSRPVLPLFDALAARFDQGKAVTPAVVRAQFGVDRAEADAWFGELRAALREVTSDSPPAAAPELLPDPDPAAVAWLGELRLAAPGDFALGGVTLTADEVRSAADALKNAPGNRVLPAFKNSGHRLADAGKTWYLGFAEQVMRAHPQLRTSIGGHYPGGHFGRVKNALIFGLDQLAPYRDATEERWDELEAAMWRLPGFDVGKVDAALEAARLVSA